MTKGTHVVSAEMAERILNAIREHTTDVTVFLDSLEGGDGTLEMTLATAHVVSLMKHNEEREIDFANVHYLQR